MTNRAFELEIIRFFQRAASPSATVLAKIISGLGSAPAYIIAILFIYWIIDEKKGIKLALLLAFSWALNEFLKALLAQPRPFIIDPGVMIVYENGFSTPSGHAQTAAAFWLGIAVIFGFRKTPAILAAALIGLSRVYLGVHYPGDVILGWIIGGCLAALLLVPKYMRKLRLFAKVPQSYAARITNLADRGSIKILLFALAAYILNGKKFVNAAAPGIFFGCGCAFVFAPRFNAAKGSTLKKFLRCVIGYAALIACAVAAARFPIKLFANHTRLLQFAVGAFAALWALAITPAFFKALGLADAYPKRAVCGESSKEDAKNA